MPVKALYIAQCGRCGLFAAPDSYPGAAFTDLALSATRETQHDAEAYAVGRGWCMYPVLCPTCNSIYREALRDAEVRGDHRPPEDGRGIPEGDQGAGGAARAR